MKKAGQEACTNSPCGLDWHSIKAVLQMMKNSSNQLLCSAFDCTYELFISMELL